MSVVVPPFSILILYSSLLSQLFITILIVIAPFYLLLWRLLPQSCSSGCCWFRLALVEVAGSLSGGSIVKIFIYLYNNMLWLYFHQWQHLILPYSVCHLLFPNTKEVIIYSSNWRIQRKFPKGYWMWLCYNSCWCFQMLIFVHLGMNLL